MTDGVATGWEWTNIGKWTDIERNQVGSIGNTSVLVNAVCPVIARSGDRNAGSVHAIRPKVLMVGVGKRTDGDVGGFTLADDRIGNVNDQRGTWILHLCFNVVGGVAAGEVVGNGNLPSTRCADGELVCIVITNRPLIIITKVAGYLKR